MAEETSAQDLKERLALIETMIAEGRRSTESWGWVFVLWGVAYCIAVVWATHGQVLSVWGRPGATAWPLTMAAASLLTLVIVLRRGWREPTTAMGRAVLAVWGCVGIALLLTPSVLAFSGRLDEHAFVAIVAAMLFVANGASGSILRWKMQTGCAVVWFVTAAAACFVSETQLAVLFLAAIFLCQIVFGLYAMKLESRRRRQRVVAHA